MNNRGWLEPALRLMTSGLPDQKLDARIAIKKWIASHAAEDVRPAIMDVREVRLLRQLLGVGIPAQYLGIVHTRIEELR